MKRSTRVKPESVDDYLAVLPDDKRAALAKLRKLIQAAAPNATEVISYQIPVYKYHGMLVGFAAFKNHCSFFVMSPSVMNAYAEELEKYDGAETTIHFTADKPLPIALVKKLVKARILENETNAKKKGKSLS
ncbi:MAG: iron chaperone [Nitrososphaera sp.]